MTTIKSRLPQTLTTQRLVLTAPTLDHVPAIAKLCNNKNIHQWMSRLPFPYAEADARFFVETVVPSAAAALKPKNHSSSSIVKPKLSGPSNTATLCRRRLRLLPYITPSPSCSQTIFIVEWWYKKVKYYFFVIIIRISYIF